MKHYILVQFCELATDRDALQRDIAALFERSLAIDGVHTVHVRPACITATNRYDLMICVDMAREALTAFDASDVHREWKSRFGAYLRQKAVFDCEDDG